MGHGCLAFSCAYTAYLAVCIASPGLVRTDNSHLIAGLNLLPGELPHLANHGLELCLIQSGFRVRPCVPVCSGFLLRSGFLPCSVFLLCSGHLLCSGFLLRSGHLLRSALPLCSSPRLHQCKVSLGGIVLILHSRRLWPDIRRKRAQDSRVHAYLPQHLRKHFHGNGPRPQNSRYRGRNIHYGGFHPDSHRTPVYNHLNPAVHILPYMVGCSGAWPSRCIGAGCGHGHSGQGNEPVCHRVVRHTDCHGIQTAGCAVGNLFTLGKYHGQGTWPESLHQLPASLRYLLYKRRHLLHAGYMGNQRIIRGPPFCSINFSCRVLVQCIAAQTVHGFCGKCHQAP